MKTNMKQNLIVLFVTFSLQKPAIMLYIYIICFPLQVPHHHAGANLSRRLRVLQESLTSRLSFSLRSSQSGLHSAASKILDN